MGGDPDMKDRVYMAIDLRNAEEKEMPIQQRNTENKWANPQSVGILF